MGERSSGEAAATVARESYGRLVAYLAARSHDIAAAEDALADAFAAALEHWPRDGVPERPEAWLLTTARRRLHDRWRHARVEAEAEPTLAVVFDEIAQGPAGARFPDERLKLMFVCAHPAIDPAARPALMLQAVLGLDAARMASAFVVAPATLSQRLVRAKAKIRAAAIAYEVPGEDEWDARLGDVLDAIYAAYGTGWDDVAGTDAATSGLAAEALALAAMLARLVPHAAEAWGLLALLAFCQSRASARRDKRGDYVPLHAQDASRWNGELLVVAESALA
ncbi:MAG: RNA polymerase subunit sigma-70, partial [Rhizobacter sp.]|nr:RNA polymerase subunit sigma-70 [Rhizobacter sp.]